MEPRLPALTVEERIIEQLTTAENNARTARSKAFEEAAERLDKEEAEWNRNESMTLGDERGGCVIRASECHRLSLLFRALAKEQTGGPTS